MVEDVTYFGRPQNAYAKNAVPRADCLEAKLCNSIRESFPNTFILDPAHPAFEEDIEFFGRRGQVMEYFTHVLLPECDRGVFLAFPDGKFGAGVYKELEWLYFELGKPVFEVTTAGVIVPIDKPDPICALSREQTINRIRDERGHWKPFFPEKKISLPRNALYGRA